MSVQSEFDVIVIGGSYAGLSAAMSLGRSLRRVLVIDGGMPCNRQTPHSHNFLTQDGETPTSLSQKAKAQVMQYDTVHFHSGFAIDAQKTTLGFAITTFNGEVFESKKIILATGIKDIFPDIKGFGACWGITVVHCPYCHGYELQSLPTGIFANGDKAFHLASLVYNLTERLSIFTSGKASFDAEQLKKLERRQIPIIETPIIEIIHEDGAITKIILENGKEVILGALYAAIPFDQTSELHQKLGCDLNEQGYIKIDTFQKTTTRGVFACGDNSNPMRAVSNAVFTGNMAGAMANKELTEDQF